MSTELLVAARDLLASLDLARGVRLLGVSVSQLQESGAAQGVLALDEAGALARGRTERRAAVERAVDAVRDRFGAGAVRPASLADGAPGPDR